MLAKAGNDACRPAMRHACAALLRGARRGAAAAAVFAARSTTAPASTAACSRIARHCGYAEARLPRLRPSAATGDPRGGRQLDRRRRRRRCVAGIDGCSAPNYAVPLAAARAGASRGSPSAEVDAGYGRAPQTLADAMTAHPEMVSGERPQRPGADAGRARRLGRQGRRRRRAGDRRPQQRLGHRHQGRRRQRARPASRRRWPCSISSAFSTTRRARRSRLASKPPSAQLPRHRHGQDVEPVVVLDKGDRGLTPRSRRARPSELTPRATVCYGKRALPVSEDSRGSAILPAGAGCRTCRSAGITTNESGTTRGWVIAKSISSSSSVRSGATSALSSCWS